MAQMAEGSVIGICTVYKGFGSDLGIQAKRLPEAIGQTGAILIRS